MHDHDHDDRITIPIASLARAIAQYLADALRAGDHEGLVDQASSPLGSRRHISAIRRGDVPGYRVGRRWLARRDDVEAFAAKLAGRPVPRRTKADELAAELARGRK